MFFSKTARILSIIALFFGLLDFVLGLSVAAEVLGPYEAARARILGKMSSGQAMDRGMYITLFAVALGTLAEINISVRRLSIGNTTHD